MPDPSPSTLPAAGPAGMKATTYTVNPEADWHDYVTLEWARQRDGRDLWAIRMRGFCWNREGEWEYEPIPSSRDDAFFGRCRFTWEEALGQVGAALAAVRGGRT